MTLILPQCRLKLGKLRWWSTSLTWVLSSDYEILEGVNCRITKSS